MNTGPGGCSKRASRARSSTPSLYFALSDRATHRGAFIGQANIAKRFLSNGRIPFGTNDDPYETYPYRGLNASLDFSLFPRHCLSRAALELSASNNRRVQHFNRTTVEGRASFVSLSLSLSAREISVTGKLMRRQGCNYTARIARK